MGSMFGRMTAFTQDIGSWTVSAVTNFTNFMVDKTPSTFPAQMLTNIYTGWTSGSKTVKPNLSINFGTAKYTAGGEAAKQLLTGSTGAGGYGWTIVDDGQV
jgi:hypothetical protein